MFDWFDIEKVTGIGPYKTADLPSKSQATESAPMGKTYLVPEVEKVFLVVRKNTIEVRTDRKLLNLLREKYESAMESRYFGRGGVEIVNSGQLTTDELNDLVRLSYNLTAEA